MILTSTARHRRSSWMDAPTRLLLPVPAPVVYGTHAVGARPEDVELPAAQFINAGPYVGAGKHALRDGTP
jgi:hypothetical protein